MQGTPICMPVHHDRPSMSVSPLNVPDSTGTVASLSMMLILAVVPPGALSGGT